MLPHEHPLIWNESFTDGCSCFAKRSGRPETIRSLIVKKEAPGFFQDAEFMLSDTDSNETGRDIAAAGFITVCVVVVNQRRGHRETSGYSNSLFIVSGSKKIEIAPKKKNPAVIINEPPKPYVVAK